MAEGRPRKRSEELVSVLSPLPQKMKDSLRNQTSRLRLLTTVPSPVNTVEERSVSGEGESSLLEAEEEGCSNLQSSISMRRRREAEREKEEGREAKAYMRSVSASVVENRKRVDWLEEGLDQQQREAKRAKTTMRAMSADLQRVRSSNCANSDLIGQLTQKNEQLEADVRELKEKQKVLERVPSGSPPLASQSSSSSSEKVLERVHSGSPPLASQSSSSSSEWVSTSSSRPQWFNNVDTTKLPEVTTQNMLVFFPKLAASWDRIGVGLGLNDKVKCVRHDAGDVESKLLVVMETWIDKGNNVAWKRLLDVLWDTEQCILARNIEQTLCKDIA